MRNRPGPVPILILIVIVATLQACAASVFKKDPMVDVVKALTDMMKGQKLPPVEVPATPTPTPTANEVIKQ